MNHSRSPSTRKRRHKTPTQDKIEIRIKSRPQVIEYSRILIAALAEIVDYDPARHHNQPPPELRIDDEGYLREIRKLIAELRTLIFLLEAKRSPPKKTAHTAVNLTVFSIRS